MASVPPASWTACSLPPLWASGCARTTVVNRPMQQIAGKPPRHEVVIDAEPVGDIGSAACKSFWMEDTVTYMYAPGDTFHLTDEHRNMCMVAFNGGFPSGSILSKLCTFVSEDWWDAREMTTATGLRYPRPPNKNVTMTLKMAKMTGLLPCNNEVIKSIMRTVAGELERRRGSNADPRESFFIHLPARPFVRIEVVPRSIRMGEFVVVSDVEKEFQMLPIGPE